MIYIPEYNVLFVDSITHALLVATILAAIGTPELIPFGILGAVIIDIDVLFNLFSSKRPQLYIFIHGGAAHSIAGAALIAALAFGALHFLGIAWEQILNFIYPFTLTIFAFTAVIAGAMLHVAIDYLASPGIPLLWPFNDTKYTLGVFAGPSIVMIFISWTCILLFIAGILHVSGLVVYGTIFLVYLAISLAVRIAAAMIITGKTFPTINPFRWLVTEKSENCWSVKFMNILTGSESGNRNWPAILDVPDEDMDRISDMPIVRRVRYHSCFTIANLLDNGDIVIQDPLRVEGIIRYPPYYTHVILRRKEGEKWEAVVE